MKHAQRQKKAQIWISDYAISLLLFTVAAFIAFKIIMNSFSVNTAFVELKTDASKISENLLSEGFGSEGYGLYGPNWTAGYPGNWTSNNVTRLGLLSGKRLDVTKLRIAMNTTLINYSQIRWKLQAKHDFLVIFENAQGAMMEFNNSCVIGNSKARIMNITNITNSSIDCVSPDFTSIDYDNMIKITRYVVYNSQIIRMVVFSWA